MKKVLAVALCAFVLVGCSGKSNYENSKEHDRMQRIIDESKEISERANESRDRLRDMVNDLIDELEDIPGESAESLIGIDFVDPATGSADDDLITFISDFWGDVLSEFANPKINYDGQNLYTYGTFSGWAEKALNKDYSEDVQDKILSLQTYLSTYINAMRNPVLYNLPDGHLTIYILNDDDTSKALVVITEDGVEYNAFE